MFWTVHLLDLNLQSLRSDVGLIVNGTHAHSATQCNIAKIELQKTIKKLQKNTHEIFYKIKNHQKEGLGFRKASVTAKINKEREKFKRK